ncbi:MAG: 50S ribosomal protein L9 [Candidatus Nanopelagicales bacterium]|jgi:large subunit ribosomal protein L9|nr:50S ribosomal protein L9 [Candidatus Nanopelagicales bacterium]MCU0295479.1 50S ribosomal protein L9 [Candidatus Nanopelagicales bacterium]MCU0299461.1 50S ribosomal protein L9 [Candidatus Nanopelagicales bacterium]
MKIILTQDVDNLGAPGDIVEVKDGYGRNYLLPRGYAIGWTKGAEKQIDQIKRARSAREIRGREHADEVRTQLEALTVNFAAKAGEAGRLFGSVTTADVAAAIKSAGGPLVEKRAIELEGHIKQLGDYPVRVALHPGVDATVTLHVVSA